MTALLTLACTGVAGEQCSGGVVGTVHERKRGTVILAVAASKRPIHGARARTRTRTVKVTVLQGSFTMAAGQTQTARIALNASGRRLLSRFGRLPVTLSLTGSITTVRKLVFSPPRLTAGTPPDTWFHINLPCSNCYSRAQSVPIVALVKGVHVTVSCRGQGCPFAHRAVTPHKHKINLASVLGGSHLQPGVIVDVAISAPGRIGVVFRYAMQRGAGPIRTMLCLRPGAKKPARCT